MNNFTKTIFCIIIALLLIVLFTGLYTNKLEEVSYASFKRGCMMQGGSLQLCNVAATEYVKIK
jgi:hypothetical protein